jgi:hypothetical protein
MTSSYDSALVDVAMIEDPRLLKLSRGIRLLHLEALVWSKAHLTDGFIPAGAINRLTDEPDASKAARELVAVGLWNMTAEGWTIVGFTDTQMSAQRVRDKRRAARERYDRYQHSVTTKRVNNAATNDPARPAPPARKGGGQVGGDGAGLARPAPVALIEVRHPQIQSPSRREMARWVREAPNVALRRAHLSAFRKTWGHLYPERPRHESSHPRLASIVRDWPRSTP